MAVSYIDETREIQFAQFLFSYFQLEKTSLMTYD